MNPAVSTPLSRTSGSRRPRATLVRHSRVAPFAEPRLRSTDCVRDTRRRSGRDNRPGVAGPPGGTADHSRACVEPARRRSRAVPRILRPQRPGLVADRLLRSRAALGRSTAAAAQLKFGCRRALPRPARPVTMQTKPASLMPDDRHPADQAVTLPEKQRKSICILDEAVVGKISDGQHASELARQEGRLSVGGVVPGQCSTTRARSDVRRR